MLAPTTPLHPDLLPDQPGRRTVLRLPRRVAVGAAAFGLAATGLVLGAAPASAAACSGTSGVTVVVDTGGSTSTKCASGDPSSAIKALTSAGFSVTYPQQFPGSVVCRINGYPEADPCVRMPPADAYWAFFHAKRGGSWVYSSNGVATYDPAPGTVVGFRFGSGQEPRVAPPEPPETSAPAPPKTTSAPRPTTSASAPTKKPTTPTTGTCGSASTGGTTASTTTAGGTTATPTASPSSTASASSTGTASATPTTGASAGAGSSPTPLALQPTSEEGDGSAGLGTLLAGGALVALVAGGAGWAAWRRRT